MERTHKGIHKPSAIFALFLCVGILVSLVIYHQRQVVTIYEKTPEDGINATISDISDDTNAAIAVGLDYLIKINAELKHRSIRILEDQAFIRSVVYHGKTCTLVLHRKPNTTRANPAWQFDTLDCVGE